MVIIKKIIKINILKTSYLKSMHFIVSRKKKKNVDNYILIPMITKHECLGTQ